MKVVSILLIFMLTFIVLFFIDKYRMNCQKKNFYRSLHKGMAIKIKNRTSVFRIIHINRDLRYITCIRKGSGFINFSFEQLDFTPKSFLFNG